MQIINMQVLKKNLKQKIILNWNVLVWQQLDWNNRINDTTLKEDSLEKDDQKEILARKSLYSISRCLWRRKKYQKMRYIQEQEDRSCVINKCKIQDS